MQYNVAAGNPFAVLTAVVAPAILTNASSVPGTWHEQSPRTCRRSHPHRCRAVGFVRTGHRRYPVWSAQLAPLHARNSLSRRCACSALGSDHLLRPRLSPWVVQLRVTMARSLFFTVPTLAVLTGASAVSGLCAGCVLMVRETQVAVKSLEEEARTHPRLDHQPHPPR